MDYDDNKTFVTTNCQGFGQLFHRNLEKLNRFAHHTKHQHIYVPCTEVRGIFVGLSGGGSTRDHLYTSHVCIIRDVVPI